MRIGIDLDGVLRDIHTPLLEAWEQKTGIKKTSKDIKGWAIDQYLELEKTGISAAEFYDWWFSNCHIYWRAPLVPGAKLGISRLAAKHSLILVTSQPTAAARRWGLMFVDNFFPGEFDAMFFGRDKMLVYLNAMIDDAVHNLEVTTARHRVLFDQPWNQDAPNDVHRAKGWEEVLDYFFGRIV